MNKALRKLLVLALAIVLSASAIVGGTYAWFTDTVTSERNTIKSGNLDAVLEVGTLKAGETESANPDNYDWKEVGSSTKLFNEDALYEPGYVETVAFRVRNNGNLAFKYNLGTVIFDEEKGINVAGQEFYLSDFLKAVVAPSLAYTDYSRSALMGLAEDTINAEGIGAAVAGIGEDICSDKVLLPDAANWWTMAIVMPTTVGNEANHNGNAPQIELGVNLFATQAMHEEDSFDNTYDEDADYDDPNVPNASVVPLSGEDLKINCSDTVKFGDSDIKLSDIKPLTFLNGEIAMDYGAVFKTTEKPEDITGKDYADWYVDFEIESTKALVESDTDCHISLAGYYDLSSWGVDLGGNWIGFEVKGVGVNADERVRVVAGYDAHITYEQIVETVKEFKCGIILTEDDDYFNGETITLHLCVYDSEGNLIDEIGEPIVCKIPENR